MTNKDVLHEAIDHLYEQKHPKATTFDVIYHEGFMYHLSATSTHDLSLEGKLVAYMNSCASHLEEVITFVEGFSGILMTESDLTDKESVLYRIVHGAILLAREPQLSIPDDAAMN
jgi:hypothetical protein